MAAREFPALGFDPAPGDAVVLGSAAAAVSGAGRVFGEASAGVGRLNSSGWSGEAAEAFRGQLADLPRDLDLAARSHTAAARALGDFGVGLVGRQRRAGELESRAAVLREQESAAVAVVNRLAARTAPAGSAEYVALKDQYDAARSRAAALGSDLQDVLADARRLHSEHRTAADHAARALTRAADAPYEEPGWLSRAWSSAESWIADHAETLRGISTVLKGVSAVLGVLSFVPGLQFLAPFAMGAAVAALLIDGALCAAGEGDWRSFAIDAALTVLPTGPVIRAANRIPPVARALKEANALIPPAVKGRLFRAVGARPEGLSRAEWADVSRQLRVGTAHIGDDVIIQGSRAGYSARPDSDMDIGVRVDPDRFAEFVRERFGVPNPGSSKERTMLTTIQRGRVHAGEAGLRTLGKSVAESIGRKVDISVIERGGLFDGEPWIRVP